MVAVFKSMLFAVIATIFTFSNLCETDALRLSLRGKMRMLQERQDDEAEKKALVGEKGHQKEQDHKTPGKTEKKDKKPSHDERKEGLKKAKEALHHPENKGKPVKLAASIDGKKAKTHEIELSPQEAKGALLLADHVHRLNSDPKYRMVCMIVTAFLLLIILLGLRSFLGGFVSLLA